ncbi:hypothetical protein INT47_008528 [Mucor saturninus]|uniref:Uncharacterized protein n=1 Tax=Mucor saturninus TaxID=64648 RepID=A0A8H7V1D8_9FUNG|nr:hypothetical protein INT47_008528 [Mucor saturninus]
MNSTLVKHNAYCPLLQTIFAPCILVFKRLHSILENMAKITVLLSEPVCIKSCAIYPYNENFFPDTSNLDYSGFDAMHHPANANKKLNDIQSDKWLNSHNNAERHRQDRAHGMRYIALRSLRYLDLVKATTQDHLRCIWLGLAKSIMSKYEEFGFFKTTTLSEVL